ncbi:D-alanine--D-alanine ligase [Dissostichus eleginoides]|uniref:D-alanine--D-alanine ligase n=1 Tax=Dissostichus eleginoides TaxID=100907 RepID=A0AAD9BKP1_DISEL|nr:D-alanine--D-alanine ligase [Dissostichus eleginoides]
MMGRLCEVALLSLVVVFLLNTESTWAKKGSSSSGRKTSSTKTQSKPRLSQQITLGSPKIQIETATHILLAEVIQERATLIQEEFPGKIPRIIQESVVTQTSSLVEPILVVIQTRTLQVDIQLEVIIQALGGIPTKTQQEVIQIRIQLQEATQQQEANIQAELATLQEDILTSSIQLQEATLTSSIQLQEATQSEEEIQDRVMVSLLHIQAVTQVEQSAVTPTGTQIIRSSVPATVEEDTVEDMVVEDTVMGWEALLSPAL